MFLTGVPGVVIARGDEKSFAGSPEGNANASGGVCQAEADHMVEAWKIGLIVNGEKTAASRIGPV